MNIQPVILSGGSGTRLWPLSRECHPKQLLKLFGDHTMLQATVLRMHGLRLPPGDILLPPLLVGNEEYRFLMAQHMQEIGVAHAPILLEPCGRNTAPAMTLAALSVLAIEPDAILVTMPADHIIHDIEAFHRALSVAIETAKSHRIVTFGIVPTTPETGYGYIQYGAYVEVTNDSIDTMHAPRPRSVTRFREKPDADTARQYLEQGDYLWNSGLFVSQADTWVELMTRYRPDILDACRHAHAGRTQDHDFCRPDADAFTACPSESIDYAVMEPLSRDSANPERIAVIPLDAQWSDLGTWRALWEHGDKDPQLNVTFGDVLTVDTRNTLVVGQDRLVATIGVDGLAIIETPDAVLVADQAHIQQVRDIVERLKQDKRDESHRHRKTYRPWGWYDCIDQGQRFKVKRIVVNPGASLSLQQHSHRAEHWVVVTGIAKVTRGADTFLVHENESTFIPIGACHRLENPGQSPLEIVEVQSGSYLEEDDIIRYEDIYGRPT